MAGIILPNTDLALFTDPEDTRVILPRVQAQSRSRRYAMTLVEFEGDEERTPFTGEQRGRSYSMTVRYLDDEHDDLADLIALFDLAHGSPDPRLLLRPHAGLVADLNPIEVVVVSEVSDVPQGGGPWDISWVAETVAYTVEV